MKPSNLLLVPALLFGIFALAYSSNPDSEVVQAKCESVDKEKAQTPAPVQNTDSPIEPLPEPEIYVEITSEDVNTEEEASNLEPEVADPENVQKAAPMRMADSHSDSEVYVELHDESDHQEEVQKSEPMRMLDSETDPEFEILGDAVEEENLQRSAAVPNFSSRRTKPIGIPSGVANKDTIRKSAPMQAAGGQVRSVLVSDRQSGLPIIRVIKPFRTAAGTTVWREVAVYERLQRVTEGASAWRDLVNNPPSSTDSYNDGRRRSPAFVGQGIRIPSNTPARRPNPGDRNDYRGNVPERVSGSYVPPITASDQGMRPPALQNPNNRRQNLGSVLTDNRGNRVPERGSGSYPPPNVAGTPFSGGAAGGQGVRPFSIQNPNNRRQNLGGAQTDFRGNVPERESEAYLPPVNPGTPFSGGGIRNPSNVPPSGQNLGGAPSDNRGRLGIGGAPFNREPNRGLTQGPGTAYNPQNTRGSPPNRKVSPDSNLFAGIVNDFAFKMVETLNLESNFVISPLSIFVALAMCYLGSDRQTKAQLEQALGLNDYAVHGDHLHKGIRDLLNLVSSGTPEERLRVANGLFLGRNFTADARFAEEIQRYYAAELKNVDFGNPDQSMFVINDWVSKSTQNAIPNLIDRPPPALTRMLLMNAVFFKGVWKTKFPTDLTYSGRFHSPAGGSKEVDTMVLLDETFPLYRSDSERHSFLKLPYDGDQISMIIALPYTENDKPMPTVRDQRLCHILDAMKEEKLDTVTIPKFRMEDVRSLRRPLLQLGVSDIFNLRAVDLSKLRRQNDVYVSAILHKAVVEVNEEGTTAAAITGVRFVPLSIRNTSDFLADHPFAFYIIHEPSGLVLFYGKIYDIGEASRTEPSPNRPRPYSSDPIVASPAAYGSASRVRIHGAVTFEDAK